MDEKEYIVAIEPIKRMPKCYTSMQDAYTRGGENPRSIWADTAALAKEYYTQQVTGEEL